MFFYGHKASTWKSYIVCSINRCVYYLIPANNDPWFHVFSKWIHQFNWFNSRVFGTWIHGILSTNLVCRHVFTAREITSFSIREKHVFSARVFTWLPYVNSRDSVDKFGVSTRVYCSWNHEFFHSWKTRVFCTCIHLIAVREFTGFCRQIWCVDTCLMLVKSRVFPFVKNTCFLHVYSPDCRTWIHAILSTNLVCRHVFTAREITSFSIRENHVFSVRVFTWLSYVNSRDSMNTFGVSTRDYVTKITCFCTCIHPIVVREFTGFYEHIWCVDTVRRRSQLIPSID